ncbi:MAG: hypothetical protein KY444_05655 [Gemmatimonadetes bacterium]|nr:hypothetical protein [Gemmatimonadota bacterium]
MPTLTRSFRRVFSRVLAVAGLSLAAVAADVSPAAAQPEKLVTGELSRYRLTSEGLQKFLLATQALDALEDSELKLREQLEDGVEDDVDLVRVAAAFDTEPQIRNAISGAGLTSREYLTFMFSIIQAMFTAGMLEMCAETALAEMENSVAKQNVQFYLEHQEQFEVIGEAMEVFVGAGPLEVVEVGGCEQRPGTHELAVFVNKGPRSSLP